jgi:hypothetical protein
MRLSAQVAARRHGVEIHTSVAMDEDGRLEFDLPGGEQGGRKRIPRAVFDVSVEELQQAIATLSAAVAPSRPKPRQSRAAVDGKPKTAPEAPVPES